MNEDKQPDNYLQTTWQPIERNGEVICEARMEIRNLKQGWEAEPKVELTEPKCDHRDDGDIHPKCLKCGAELEPLQDTDYDKGYQAGLKDGNSRANAEAERRINEAYDKGVKDTLKKLKLSDTKVKLILEE